jgi:hypothetical protein
VRALLVATAIALALGLPAVAAAQGGTSTQSPFTPGLPSSPAPIPTPAQTTPTVVTPTTSTSGGSLGGGGIAAISVGALLLIGGISFFIWYDARRRAPVRNRIAAATAGDGGRPGSKQRPKQRKLSPAERRRRKRGRAR